MLRYIPFFISKQIYSSSTEFHESFSPKFYVPAILGLNYLPVLLISFAITDLVIGYHSGTFFTWGSVFVIGLMANYLSKIYH